MARTSAGRKLTYDPECSAFKERDPAIFNWQTRCWADSNDVRMRPPSSVHTYNKPGKYSIVIRGKVTQWEDMQVIGERLKMLDAKISLNDAVKAGVQQVKAKLVAERDAIQRFKDSIRMVRSFGTTAYRNVTHLEEDQALFENLYQNATMATSLPPDAVFQAHASLGVSMRNMFQGATSFRNISVAGWKADVLSFHSTFQRATNLATLNGSANLGTSKLTNLQGMFDQAINLFDVDPQSFAAWQLDLVTSIGCLFRNLQRASRDRVVFSKNFHFNWKKIRQKLHQN